MQGSNGLGPRWNELSPTLSTWTLEVIRKMGFERMTPVQASTIPRAMKNQDCVVEAVTGSGKTLAFVLPTLERLLRRGTAYKKGQVAAVVVAPTRELAQQIHDVFHLFLSHQAAAVDDDQGPLASTSRAKSPSPTAESDTTNLSLPLLVTSGTQNAYETFLAQSSTIIIGTPGRLASFFLSPRGISVVRVSELEALILDEADRLLSSPDHRRDVERLMRHFPKQRRTHLFSATMTDAVEEMIGLGLRNPVRIVVNLKDKRVGQEPQERRTPTGLRNFHLVCRHAEKTLQLVRLLLSESKHNEAAKFIVYFATGAQVDYFYRILSKISQLQNMNFISLYGDLPPRVRETALNNFVSHASSHLLPAILLCTDVAARGVDFIDVDVVLQYDPPTDPKTFSHRAGRTARAGKRGKAVCLLGQGREEEYVDFMAVRKIPLVRHGYINEDLQQIGLPTELDPAAVALLPQIRQVVLADRELADRAAKAFVSFLRAYTKHEASYIFRAADLDFHGLAIAYGLLRIPAMPEVREWQKKRDQGRLQASQAEAGSPEERPAETPWADAQLEWDTFTYISKPREEARLAALAIKRSRPSITGQDDEKLKKRKIRDELREAWSDKKDRKARKEERRERKDKRKAAEWATEQAEGTKGLGMVEAFTRKKEQAERVEEWDKEYKTLKKEVKEERVAKKGKREDKVESGMFDGLD